MLFLVLATGRGREWAPVAALMFGLLALPGCMLADGWLLFVSLRRPLLLLAGLAVPAYVAVALTIFVHGSRGERNAGAAMLETYFDLVDAAEGRGMLFFLLWLAAMAALVVTAVRRERRLVQ